MRCQLRFLLVMSFHAALLLVVSGVAWSQETRQETAPARTAQTDKVTRLIKDLQNPDESIRLRAAKELAKIGPAAHDALPMLHKLMQDPDDDVRQMATAAVARVTEAIMPPPGGSRPDLYMLSVGIDRYQPPINGLSGCVNDAAGMAKLFQRQAGKLYGRVEVQLLTDDQGSRAKIDAGIETLRKKGKNGDWYVIVMSGHGAPKLNTWGFVTHEGSNITDAALLKLADELASADKKVLIIIDACFAGQMRIAAHSVLNKHQDANKGGIILMLSSMPAQTSAALQRYSAFARAVEEGLTGSADYDGDRTVTLKELRRFTYHRVYELCLDKRALPGLPVLAQDSAIDASLSMAETTPLVRAETSPSRSERDDAVVSIPPQLAGVWNLGSYRLRFDANGVFRATVISGNRPVQQGDGIFKFTGKHVILHHKQGIDRLELTALTDQEFSFRFQGREQVLLREKRAVQTNSIVDTTWTGSESLAEFGKLTFKFEADGQAVMIDARSTVNGAWTQDGDQVTITFANCVYQGAIKGQTLSGNAHFVTEDRTWTFTVTRAGPPAKVPADRDVDTRQKSSK